MTRFVTRLVRAGVLALSLTTFAASPASAQEFAGTVTNHRKLSMLEGGITAILPGPGLFGVAVCDIGDLDLDGTPDLMVGAYVDSEFVAHAGAAYVFFMRPNGTVKSHTKIGSNAGGFNVTLDPLDMFGWSLANMGDMDGDGVVDIAVGAWLDDQFPTFDQGAIYILFMKRDGTVKSHTRITAGVGGFNAVLYTEHRFGTSLTNMGDVDGDGVNDLLAGAIYDNDAAYIAGAVFMLFMNADGTVRANQKITMGQGGFFTGIESQERFGYASCNIGDLDGDGIDEAAVTAFLDNDGGPAQGSVYILWFYPDGYVKQFNEINMVSGNFPGELEKDDSFGSSVARLPDLNGDGICELAVGAIGDDHGGDLRGKEYILFLASDGSVHGCTEIASELGGFEGILDDADRFGQSSCCLGDLDGDGTIELAVGADHDDDGSDDAGAVWILSLRSSAWVDMGRESKGPVPSPSFTATGTLEPNTPVSIDLGNSLPGTLASILLSTAEANLPVLDTLLVPSLTPPSVLVPVIIDSGGGASLAGNWPLGVPAGFNFYAQALVLGTTAEPTRIVLSNAIRGVAK